MKNQVARTESERGIALIVVLLLMAVLSGLATGFALTGQTEVAMSTNEVYFAGARAAAEAGMNRALVAMFADNTTVWLSGADGAQDTSNASATVNADNGSLTFLLGSGPYYVDTAQKYSYSVQIYDDDDPVLYSGTSLVSQQLTPMGEDGSAYTDANNKVVLRATGYGPNGTVMTLARTIEITPTTSVSTSTNNVLSNPAILVNGDFLMNGNITVGGTSGSVHANGNITKTGASGSISGTATATGTYSGPMIATGGGGGGRASINVPDVHASDYMSIADYKLTSTGTVQTKVGGVWTNCTTSACKSTGWTFSGGTWSSAKNPSPATYYIDGNASVGPTGTGGSGNVAMSIIATGNIDIQSSQAKLTPENTEKYQFVCDGDLTINAADLDDTTSIEGQILVRGQMDAGGSMEFQGRVIIQDVAGAGSTVANGGTNIHGSVNFTYNGTLGAISTTVITTTTGPTTYVNNVSGWMEQ